MSSQAREGNPFDRRVVVAVVIAGVLAFAAFLWLSAYAPAVRQFDASGFAPMSKNAIGFGGTVKLIGDVTGEEVATLEDNEAFNEPGLVIMPLSTASNPQAVRSFAEDRARNVPDGATLFVLPKWSTRPVNAFSGDWVQRTGLSDWGPKDALANKIAGTKLFIEQGKDARLRGLPGVERPLPPQTTAVLSNADGVSPILTIDDWRSVLVRVDDIDGGAVYLLTDPDLLSNHALKTPAGARTAMAIVAAVRPEAEDQISVNPVPVRGPVPKRERNLLQLMFEPPFLGLTLAILAAALLAALHAFGRFGPTLPEPRAIPFGKRALADNTAVLFERAGAVARLGERYVALVRDAAGQALGATHLAPDALEAWLSKLPRVRGPNFAALAATLRGARDAEGVRAGAAALHDWRDEVMRDR